MSAKSQRNYYGVHPKKKTEKENETEKKCMGSKEVVGEALCWFDSVPLPPNMRKPFIIYLYFFRKKKKKGQYFTFRFPIFH